MKRCRSNLANKVQRLRCQPREMSLLNKKRNGLLLAGLLALMPTCHAQANRNVVDTWHIGGEGQWDYVTVDPATHRIFVTRTTHTQVLDGTTGHVLGDIPGQIRSHGVALAPSVNRGFITDGGGSGSIVVFDLKTYAILGRLAAMPDADGIIFDAALNRVLAVSGDGNALFTFKADIDPSSGKIDPPIGLGGSPEFLASDGSGKVYVNLQDKDVVAEVDLAARKVIAQWPVAPGGNPVGLSIEKEHHHLFIGCRKPQKLVVMSTEDGRIVAALPIGAGVDATAFDSGQAFASTRDGLLTVIGERGGSFEVEQVVKTMEGARTMGVDASTHKIYLPTALFETASSDTAASRPKPKPDSFMVLEVERTPSK
jgi:DNA-binding beta-propeller fold protein YncE